MPPPATADHSDPHARDAAPPRTRAWPWGLAVLVFAALAFGVGLERLPLKGEESRRGRFASEMIASGDWVVTTQQGQVFVDRPPLQYWAISAAYLLSGEQSIRALRATAAAATVLAALLVFWYAAHLIGPRAGAFAASAFVTMGLMLDIGRKAEAESIFTLLLAGSLLVWHGGLIRGWPSGAAWAAGYGLAALATLTKGTQAPVAFVGATVLWLALERRWRTLLSPGHALGALVYAAIVGAWLAPLVHRLGWEGVRDAFIEPGRERFDAPWWQYLRHWALFPLEALVIMMPWSLLLPGCRALLRRHAGDPRRAAAIFLLVAMGVLFIPLWLAPWARGRYFLPAFPLAAALVGLVVSDATAPLASDRPARLLRLFTRTAAWLFLLGSGGLAISPWTRDHVGRLLGSLVADPWAPVAIAAAATGATGAVLLRAAAGAPPDARRITAALALASACIALLYQTLAMRALVGPAVDTPAAVRDARAALPPGAHLVSLGPIHHRFAFFWGDPIRLIPAADPQRIAPGEYFCADSHPGRPLELPFAWKGIASIGMHVYRRDDERTVVIGQRAPDSRAQVAP